MGELEEEIDDEESLFPKLHIAADRIGSIKHSWHHKGTWKEGLTKKAASTVISPLFK